MKILRTDSTFCIPVGISNTLPKSDQMVLLEDLEVELFNGLIITIPKGFITDLHSTPPWTWSILPAYHNRTALAPIMHDFLYMYWEKLQEQYLTLRGITNPRKFADRVYYVLMEQTYSNFWRNWLYYKGVRWFGWSAWNKYRTLNLSLF